MRTGRTLGKHQAQCGNIRRTVCQDREIPQLAGRSFGSRLERGVGRWLATRENKGEITELRFQVTVHMTRARIGWRIDFCYVENGQLFYHEAKGREIEPYPTQIKLYRTYGPEPLRVSKGKEERHKVIETIYPKDWIADVDEKVSQGAGVLVDTE